MDKLKKYHAYYVMAVIFILTCFVEKTAMFFPFACIFLCLGVVGQLKDEGRLVTPADEKRKAKEQSKQQ
jgi:hypothetical protein